MKIKKKDVNKFLALFLLAHIVIWTLIPSIVNNNLPLDTIEALAWGNEFRLGYDKYPPLFPLFTELFYQIFGNQDWAYYFLSQLFVTLSFFIIFKFSENFFQNKINSLISVLLLEGIYFFNYTTPELNPYIGQLPFLAATVFYCWQGIERNENASWFLFGIFAGLAVLTFYLSFYLLCALGIFFIYIIIKEKKFNPKYLITLIIFFIVLLPHLIWIVDSGYTTIHYALFRSFGNPLAGLEGSKLLDHIFYPLTFLGKQIGILVPFFVMFFFIVTKFKTKINYSDKKLLFLISITILPIILMFITSLISGSRIRTMWMTSFYLFTGVFFVYIFQAKINLKKFKNFFIILIFLFVFSPTVYYLDSHTQKNKRTDYPGKKISQIVQTQWDNNFSDKIKLVVGAGWINGWYAQNLSYHLDARPKWRTQIDNTSNTGIIWIKGFNEINVCRGVLYKIETFNDICMLGKYR